MSEDRWSPEEFQRRLLDFYKKEPQRMSQDEFEDHLAHTTAYRYRKGSDLVNEVQAYLDELKRNGQASDIDTTVMVDKLNKAVVAFGYGAVRYNSTLQAGATKRPEPWGSDTSQEK